ncbi:hypothetical protein OAI47_00765, partial [Rhodospirillaceae bacterium]|nr:hypothetical protein [Rhodospirillaceae bacterium]
MSQASRFDTDFYVFQNPDVAEAIRNNQFDSALQHFQLFGGRELRAPNGIFSPSYYEDQNPDVERAISSGGFDNYFHHYQVFGQNENRIPAQIFEGFDSDNYLNENPDIAAAINMGMFDSALHHFISFGQNENRDGAFATVVLPYILTKQQDSFSGTLRDDVFIARINTLQLEDILDGNGGNDKLSITLGAENSQITRVLSSNVSEIENLVVSGANYQTIDFSNMEGFENITIASAITVDGNASVTTLGLGQSLTLMDITDGDTDVASLNDGGIKIVQADPINSLELVLQGVGPKISKREDNLFIDIAGAGVTDANITIGNENSIFLKNSGNALTNLNFSGTGRLDISDVLGNSVRNINGGDTSAHLGLSSIADDANILTGSGNDSVSLVGGNANVDTRIGDDKISVIGGSGHVIITGDGHDNVNLSGGVTQVITGSGHDIITANSGSNTIDTGDGEDIVTFDGGTNYGDTGGGNDIIHLSGGNNFITTQKGIDSVVVSGGLNIIETGAEDDTISVIGGTSIIITGDGNDTVTASGTANITSLDGGAGADVLRILSPGGVTVPTALNFETLFVTTSVHQSLDYSASPNLTNVELESGTTIDNATIVLTLGAGQALTLDGITDGDTVAASLADGGIQIAQASSINSLDLTLSDVGPTSSIANENVFIDIAGTAVALAK